MVGGLGGKDGGVAGAGGVDLGFDFGEAGGAGCWRGGAGDEGFDDFAHGAGLGGFGLQQRGHGGFGGLVFEDLPIGGRGRAGGLKPCRRLQR